MINENRQPKDPILASEHNEIAKVARSFQSLTGGRGVRVDQFPSGTSIGLEPSLKTHIPAAWAWAVNVGDTDLEAFRPAVIIGSLYGNPGNSDDERITECILQVMPVTELDEDSQEQYEGHFVIASKLIEPNKVGITWSDGIGPAYLVAESAEDTRLEIQAGVGHLVPNPNGSARVVSTNEFGPGEQIGKVRFGSATPPEPPLMVAAQDDMVADNTLYDAVTIAADGTQGETVELMRPNGVRVKSGNVGFIGTDTEDNAIFIDAHSWPKTPGTTSTVGVLTEGTEAALTDTFDILGADEGKGLILNFMTRVAYYDAGNETLYGYSRSMKVDAMGHLISVSGETRVTIDVPDACP